MQHIKCLRGESVFQAAERVLGKDHGLMFGSWQQRPSSIPEDWVLRVTVSVRASDPDHGFYGPPAEEKANKTAENKTPGAN